MSDVVMALQIDSASEEEEEGGEGVFNGGSKFGIVNKGESHRAEEEGSSKRDIRLSSLHLRRRFSLGERAPRGGGGTHVDSRYISVEGRVEFHPRHLSGGAAMKTCPHVIRSPLQSATPYNRSKRIRSGAHSTKPHRHFPRSTIHLIPAPFDIIHSIHDHYIIRIQMARYSAQ